ncbi:MAG: hypothetical protein L0191_04665 [Acidobacteria bacterium]|nr:hypothetical protein [Acidobacteriota bacterium]
MNPSLEVPFRPGWPSPRAAHIEPPLVALEPRWEYKDVVREVATGLLSEAELNVLGAEHWELTGIVPAGPQVHFYFKRERHF